MGDFGDAGADIAPRASLGAQAVARKEAGTRKVRGQKDPDAPKKPIRSVSGVSVVTVVTMPFACPHGRCVYCPGGVEQGIPSGIGSGKDGKSTDKADNDAGHPSSAPVVTPNSYTHLSPAIMRAMTLDYDPYQQVRSRLAALKKMNHPASKIELIIIGGTFLFFPPGYCEQFVKRCFDALNDGNNDTKTPESNSANLEEAQRKNETAPHRCVAFCVETKPELCTEENIKTLLRFGVTRVEVGVQMPDDDIYKRVNRGHTVKDVVDATAHLRDAGFKVGYHMMPNLPGSSMEKDKRLFASLFSDPRFRPDQIKIYPTQAVKGSLLEKWFDEGKFVPYTEEDLLQLLAEMKAVVPPYCRIMRIQRQISQSLMRNPFKGDLRKAAKELLIERGTPCKCIRCKEYGFNRKAKGPWQLHTLIYDTGDANNSKESTDKKVGKEWFISWQNPDGVLKGIIRLRKPARPFVEGTTDTGKNATPTLFVRELHVYGTEIAVDEEADAAISTTKATSAQHEGIGKALMQEAERIAKEQGCRQIAVISGVGAREYYRRLGYSLQGPYMVRSV